jgi:hypothetical protein
MRLLASTTAIVCVTAVSLQLIDAEYLPAAVLLAAGVAAYLTRRAWPPPGKG